MLRLARRLLSLPLQSRRVRPIRRMKPLPFQPKFDTLEDRVVPDGRPLPFPVIYVGAEFGAPPTVKAYDAETGKLNFERTVYESTFTGGVNVATADITGDKYPDLIVGPGEGGSPRIRVFDGKTGEQIDGPLGNFWAYLPIFTGGVEVAAGDVNGDKTPDIITAAGVGGGPHIKAFDGKTGDLLQNFFAFNPDFLGGVSLAAADLNFDNKADIVVGAGYGGGPHVKVFDAMSGSPIDGPLGNFFAFDPEDRSGVHVGADALAGDVTGDHLMDLLVGAGKGQAPEIKVYNGLTGRIVHQFQAFDKGMKAGVRPAVAYVTDDSFAEIVVGTGKGEPTRVRVFDGQTAVQLSGAIGEYQPFGANSQRGVNVTASNDPLLLPYSHQVRNPSVVGVGQPFWITMFVERASPSDPLPTGTVDFVMNGNKLNDTPVALTAYSSELVRASFFVSGGGVGKTPGSPPYSFDQILTTYSGDSNYYSQYYDTGHATVGYRPVVDCSCDPNLKAEEAAGTGNYGTTQTTGGIGFDGSFDLSRTDLTGGSFDQEFSQGWALSTSTWRGDSQAGAGTLSGLSMRIVQNNANQSLYAVDGGAGFHAFDQIPAWDGTLSDTDPYVARYGSLAGLTHDISNQRFIMTDGRGNKFTFYDFTVTTTAARGRLEKMADENGLETVVNGWLTSGYATSITRVTGSGGTAITDTLTNSGTGTVNSVTLSRTVGTGSPVTIGSVEYSYPTGYGGSPTRLERATVKDASGTALETSYYRYYTSGPIFSFNPVIKLALGPAAYARAKAYADSISSTVDALSDSTLQTYADHYLEYGTSESRTVVTKHVVAGEGCSSCSGGQGTYTYAYYSNPNGYVFNPNKWAWRVTETAPDGSINVYYTNRAGELLVKDVKTSGGSSQGIEFFQYNSDWQLVMKAGPDAVSGYDEAEDDLVEYVSGNATYLRDSDGEFTHYSYNADGLQESVSISLGETASEIIQSETEYVTRTVSSQDFFFPDSTTQYVNTNGTGAEEWTTAYTWQGSTSRIESITVTAPIVTTAHNGSNSATSTVTFMDTYGRPIWQKDEAGFISYAEYDSATGSVVKLITDVDTTQTSNEPSGWTTPGGGGLHLTSTYEVDAKGRVTKSTAPNGRIDYTVYDDDSFEVRSYPGWNTSTNLPTGPTIVSREDRAKGYTESLTMSATPTVSSGRPTGTESIGSLQSLSRSYVNEVGQTVTQDEYFNLSGLTYSTAANIGTLNTHYYRTTVAYTHGGQMEKTTSPLGTISRTVFDTLGRPISEWIGTDDTPTTGYWSPTNLTGTNMVKVSETEYDHGGNGPGNVTKQTLIPGGGAGNRVTETWYDLRNRPVWVKSGVAVGEVSSTNRPITYTDYDNLGRVVKTRVYDGDTITVTDSNSDGVPDAPPAASALRIQTTASYDELGRVYLSEIYFVNPNDGSLTTNTNTLETFTWYDARGQVIKTSSPGGLVQKSVYDGAYRSVTSYVTDGGGDSGYADADDVTGDKVLEQSESAYDASGNVLSQTVRQRNHDETGTGALGTASTGNKARVSHVAYYYDVGDRTTAVADYGTYGASSWTRPGTVASRSDTVLVSSVTYDAAGRTYETTDPKGLINRTTYDALGRTLKTIENYVDGTVGDDNDKTTEYTYNAAGMKTLTAKMTGGGVQTTEWIYGVATGGGSTITSNDVSVETRWPDPSTGASSSSQKDLITINALGQPLTSTDRNGNVHTYLYDEVGRRYSDAITTLGSGVDGTIRRMEVRYDIFGQVFVWNTYDAASSGNIVNSVQRSITGLGQLALEYQEHNGIVVTGGGTPTPYVGYGYTEMTGGANHSRLTYIQHPNTRMISYDYGTGGGLNDTLSRVAALKDGATTLESYDYLGLGTVVKRSHAQSGVDLTYIKASGEGNGDAGDQYTGLDRFGRAIDQRWRASSAEKDRYQYGYDRNGNRLYRDNLVNTALGELYAYDNLNQLSSFDRGTLNGSKNGLTGAASRSQDWDYDALGNFDSVTTDGGSAATRTHNKQNEITAVSGSTSPVFDANGNMTTDETGKQYVYDAWNRLVTVKNSGGTTIASYEYDGMSRRIQETAGGVTTDLYYSDKWQVIEERVSGTATKSYVWSPVYVDAMVARDRDTDANGSLDERLYVMHDANFNVTGLVNTSGTVVERYTYDPYGVATVRDGSWTAGSTAYVWQYNYQTGRTDINTGLVHFRNREYSSTLSRWTSQDPKGHEPDLNVYRSISNNPLMYSDPWGLDKQYYTQEYGSTSIWGTNDGKSEDTGWAKDYISLIWNAGQPRKIWGESYLLDDYLNPIDSEGVVRSSITVDKEKATYEVRITYDAYNDRYLRLKRGDKWPVEITGVDERGKKWIDGIKEGDVEVKILNNRQDKYTIVREIGTNNINYDSTGMPRGGPREASPTVSWIVSGEIPCPDKSVGPYAIIIQFIGNGKRFSGSSEQLVAGWAIRNITWNDSTISSSDAYVRLGEQKYRAELGNRTDANSYGPAGEFH